MDRSAGILLSISSLPSPYGIGSLGKTAHEFVDFLVSAGQTYWQMLPVGPTSYGDSPYQSFSSFAGNPYFIDLDELAERGLLDPSEYQDLNWGGDPRTVDYQALYQSRFHVLRLACSRLSEEDLSQLSRLLQNAGWLEDYALFMALKDQYGGVSWFQWPEEARLRRPEALDAARKALAEDIQFWKSVQYLFFDQWWKLKQYANQRGVSIIGDLPIYVAADSADVWASPDQFQLDSNGQPTAVAGCPPDGFSADGQLWGNPIYDWDRMKSEGFAWWERRLRGTLERFDIFRLDHFRGLESYWSVPYGSKTAAAGHWEPGPGMDFIQMLRRTFPDVLIIAEDLGYITPEVHALREGSGFPGMKVLEFAFDRREAGDYLPHSYPVNCVCYAGTHDNDTILGWLSGAHPEDADTARRYWGLNEAEGLNWGVLRGGMSSPARLFVAQMQDYLGLDGSARMNTPGRLGGNWQWRMLPGAASPELAARLKAFTALYGR